ncbi:hypothetical protein DYB34_005760 [Aphanomyces astaci]|uniref:GB1/RHD3-type G domain-containing protein n=1 Tax=Aphanomyces astaci TaxID=112090 RepID=A0A3R6XAA1_APHAT|nr:hypothetical protein DYB34_005760 [Aphanomyces astaci]
MCRKGDVSSVPSTNAGFVVGPTTESCTRGIWIWDADQRNARGEKVLLMDTEGIASTDNDETYDAKIFSLGLLLCSVFVFNTMGVIDEGAIDRLFLVSELTKHVCVHQHGGAADNHVPKSDDDDDDDVQHSVHESALAPHFPPFVWLLRDFLLDIQENGLPLTSNVYLERSLQRRDGTSKRNEERNRIRHSLRTLFTQRECMTLIRPVTDEDKLRNASTLPDADLRPEFIVQMRAIRDRLLDVARPKRVLNQVVDGPKLAHLVQSYVATMNSGAVPDIKAAWEYVSDVTCEAAFVRALDTYKTAMESNTSMAQVEFERVHKEAQDGALVVFKSESVEGDARKRCFQKLKAAIAQTRALQINALQEKSTLLCTDVVERLAQQWLQSPIDSGEWDDIPSDGRALGRGLTPFFHGYDEAGDGPSKTKVLVQFVKSDLPTILDQFIGRLSRHHQSVLEQATKAADDTIRVRDEVRRRLELEVHQLQLEGARLVGVVSTVEEKLDRATQQVVTLKQATEDLHDQLVASEAKRLATGDDLDAVKAKHAALVLDNVKLTAQLEHVNQALDEGTINLIHLDMLANMMMYGWLAVAARQATQDQLTSDLHHERAERKNEREGAIANLAKQAAELHAAQRSVKACRDELDDSARSAALVAKERDLLSVKIKSLLEVHENSLEQLHIMETSHALHADEKERLTLRCERLEQQLGDVSVHMQVENVLTNLCVDVVKLVDADKAIRIVTEERAALQERLGELHEKISTLPDFYQRQVFCAHDPSPDFFEALTQLIGQ